MENSLSLLFYIKKSKTVSSGRSNIYLRITMDDLRAELSIRRKVLVDKWSTKMNMARGTSDESLELNEYISTIKIKYIPLNNSLFPKINLLHRHYYEIYI